MSWINTAHAMGAGQSAGGGEANMLMQFLPFIAIFVVFYFLLIRPQQKKAKEQQQMLAGLKKGDAVLTAGGMFGRIVEIDGDVMLVDLGETKVKMGRSYLAAAPQNKQAAPPLKNDKKDKKSKKGEAVQENAPVEAAVETEAVKVEAAPVVSGSDSDKPAVQ